MWLGCMHGRAVLHSKQGPRVNKILWRHIATSKTPYYSFNNHPTLKGALYSIAKSDMINMIGKEKPAISEINSAPYCTWWCTIHKSRIFNGPSNDTEPCKMAVNMYLYAGWCNVSYNRQGMWVHWYLCSICLVTVNSTNVTVFLLHMNDMCATRGWHTPFKYFFFEDRGPFITYRQRHGSC